MEFPERKVGDQIGPFRITKVCPLEELSMELVELEHEGCGARVLQLLADDDENVFCLGLRTLPDSSNGVAHILEHTVLCGSQRYPVPDPFFSMMRRSLNTYMNALTGADFTCYPAASQVKKDFYNLMDVYLDAVFHPELKDLSFLQEGHRFDFQKPGDPKSDLIYKGIVFNEMKGAMSSANSRVWDEVSKRLYPDLTYGVNSGGDPKVIPELTYEGLKDFHQTYYHPSRCLFYFYGNLPLEGHLDFIEDRVLKNAERLDAIPPLPKQARFSAPVREECPYPVSPTEDDKDKAIVAMAWLCCSIDKQEDLLGLGLLDSILMGHDGAPLKKALLQSQLCKEVKSMFDEDMSEAPYAIVLRGCEKESAKKLEELLRNSLEEIVSEGFSQEQIDAALHLLEFDRKEITGDGAPYGLSLFFRCGLLMQQGGEAEKGLQIHSIFKTLRQLLCHKGFLENLARQYLLENQHFVRVTLVPDKEMQERDVAEEKAKLQEIQKTLTEDRAQKIIQENEALTRYQEEQANANLEVLPKVGLEDVPSKSKVYPLSKSHVGALQVSHHACFTNEIVYGDLVFDLPDVPEKDLGLVRLFSTFLAEMGCGGRSYADNLEYMQRHTGGVDLALGLNVQADQEEESKPSISLRGKALEHKADKLFPLMGDMLLSVDWKDPSRLKELLLQHYSSMEHHINSNAMRYAINQSARGLSKTARITNLWFGLDYFCYVRDLVNNFDSRIDSLIENFEALQKSLFASVKPNLVLSCSSQAKALFEKEKFYGLADLSFQQGNPWKGLVDLPEMKHQGRVIASQVAFTGKVFRTVPYSHPHSAALSVASQIFNHTVLHKRIREQGGAYGGGSSNNPLIGHFYFYAYRDPNLSKTLEAFREAAKYVTGGNLTDRDLEEAKLSVIQGLDSPMSPGSRAFTSFVWEREGLSPEKRQSFRDRLLNLTKKEVEEAVASIVEPGLSQSVTVSFAGKELLEREKPLTEESLEILSI